MDATSTLSQEIMGEVPSYTIITLLDTLEDLETSRDRNMADLTFRDFIAKHSAMLRQPTMIDDDKGVEWDSPASGRHGT